ncbi:hypothetical protein HAX54_000580, partial [Datura stramonium]|nr:hypothetical protein [Datura stramonium]
MEQLGGPLAVPPPIAPELDYQRQVFPSGPNIGLDAVNHEAATSNRPLPPMEIIRTALDDQD